MGNMGMRAQNESMLNKSQVGHVGVSRRKDRTPTNLQRSATWV